MEPMDGAGDRGVRDVSGPSVGGEPGGDAAARSG